MVRQGRLSSSRADACASWPRTTMTGSRPAASARPAARRRTLSPSRRRRSLLRPIRLEGPAARRTPATLPARARSGDMDRALLLAQGPGFPGRVDREDLRDDRDRDLLGPVGAEVEPHGAANPVVLREAELPQDLAGPRAGAEHSHVRDLRGEEQARPLPVVREGVRLDDRVAPWRDGDLSASLAGPLD